MSEERTKILNRVNELIQKRKEELLNELPSVHEVDDGIIIRLFTEWDFCEDDTGIKYKKMKNLDNLDESVVFFFIPKGAFFDLKQRFYIGCITCLNGRIDITVNGNVRFIESGTKICVESNEVQGLALENTYLISTSDRNTWSQETREHVQKSY